MKNKKKYYGIIAMLIYIIVMTTILKQSDLQTNVILIILIVSTILQVCCVKLIMWLFKHYHPTNATLCTAIVMLMIAIISFIIWVATYTVTSICLTIAIVSAFFAITLVLLSQIITFAMYIKRKWVLKKKWVILLTFSCILT